MSAETSSSSANEPIAQISGRSRSNVSRIAAQVSLVLSIASLFFLGILHILSPEFNPSWRMVSEYALGKYSWVLSLMFAAWGLSSWALAFAARGHVKTAAGKLGLIFLVLAGIGEAMASVFDISHPLHSVVSMIGIPSLPIAAMLISTSLARTPEWSAWKKALLWTANLTWVSVLLMAATFIILITTYTQAGGDMTAPPTVLPPGVIALVGWANRLLIVVYCVWVMTVARLILRMPSSERSSKMTSDQKF